MLERLLNFGIEKKYFIIDLLDKVSDKTCKDNKIDLINFDKTKEKVVIESNQMNRKSCDGLYLNDNINFIEFKSFIKIKEKLSPKENIEVKERKFINSIEVSLIDKIESSIWILDFIINHKLFIITKDEKSIYRKIEKNYYMVVDIDLNKHSIDTFLARLNGLSEIPSSLYDNLITNVKTIVNGIELNIKINKPLLIDCKELKERLTEQCS